MKRRPLFLVFCILAISLSTLNSFAQNQSPGIFDNETDVGRVRRPGSTEYNANTQQYTISGAGTNIWFGNDEFHFVWKKMKGDFILRTHGAFIGKGTELHRKWGWMVRTSLDSNSKHVNAVVHGDGLTSLQFRKKAGENTEEMKAGITFADVVQLERKGRKYIMSAARSGETFVTQELADVDLGDDVYVGLFVCSHNADVTENAIFSNVRIVVPAPDDLVPYKQYIGSHLEILDVTTQKSRIIYQASGSIQAPNWNKDGKSLIYNADGLLYQFDLATNVPKVLNTGAVRRNNNDHVLSFDGKMLALSSGDGENGASVGYVMPNTGGTPRRVTSEGPSYMHGWSPDGKYLVYTAQRNKEFDIYRIPVAGGAERRLTTAPGLEDGPEYTPDGKFIFFNSVRTGLMQIWRMKANGSGQTQMTDDGFNNWFPHISPDGKWVVFISFLKEEVRPDDHPFYKHVYIRMMPAAGGPAKVIAYLYGGQGTINTPSWSPDSKQIALVSNSKLLFRIFPGDDEPSTPSIVLAQRP
jgi:Tol biopolymer transport system component